MGHFASYYKSKKSYVPFVPTDIAGCQLWLKADAGITKDGSNYVSQWADQSGNNNHAVQATGSAQPLWADGLLNGKPVINFNGTSNFLDFPSGMLYNLSAISFFIVIKPYDITTNKGYFAPSLYYNQGISLYSYPDWTLNINGSRIFSSAPNAIITESTWTLSNFKYSPSGTTGFINSNSIIPYDSTYKGALSLNGIYALGRYANSFGSYYGKMIVSELIIYNSSISDADRQLVENYINTKYAIW
jgi:hypothetical protein